MPCRNLLSVKLRNRKRSIFWDIRHFKYNSLQAEPQHELLKSSPGAWYVSRPNPTRATDAVHEVLHCRLHLDAFACATRQAGTASS